MMGVPLLTVLCRGGEIEAALASAVRPGMRADVFTVHVRLAIRGIGRLNERGAQPIGAPARRMIRVRAGADWVLRDAIEQPIRAKRVEASGKCVVFFPVCVDV